MPDIVIFQACQWWDTWSYDASWVSSVALGTALCSWIGEMFIAAKSQKPQTLYSSKLIPLVKLLQVHFRVSLMGIQRVSKTIRRTPQYTGITLTAQLLWVQWWDILLSLRFFCCIFFFRFGVAWLFLDSLHSECTEAQIIEINSFHRDDVSVIYIKDHMPNQGLWVHHKQLGSRVTDFGR